MLIKINNIKKPLCFKSYSVRGRGSGSCKGCKSGRGSGGQKVRSGGNNPHTEGGQYPSYLRWNKIGFLRKSIELNIVKLSNIDKLSYKLSKSILSINDIIVNLKLEKFLKIKILFDKKPKFCKSCETHFASQKVKEYLNIICIL